ncbi:hypothetical protein QA612_16580 [Evansella sp. AB-P1]|uniref:hypothetical protein n=1 Tax=Evansella sp. AB-P1 TaxID=3037653 RepID=UPI00241D1BF8|nr:hypothetical protein [Evansella sp. AB-P1]MDG5789075.1 hypothetical protein [Evansella sp. AB-P1]
MRIPEITYKKTSNWIKRNSRPLEEARWDYLFEGGSDDRVINLLSSFQNKDGGFGHGIEPDFWSPYSSPMATWTAGQVLMEVKANPNITLIEAMIAYLVKTNDSETGMWPSVLPENNHHPHAPWWHWEEGVQKFWMFNPSVELGAFLIHWSKKESEASQIGWNTIRKAIERLMHTEEMDKHEINNYQQCLRIIHPQIDIFYKKTNYKWTEVSSKVHSLVERCMNKDSSSWSEDYEPMPLDFITGPNDELSNKYSDLVERNLQFYIDQMSGDGIWDISWSWGSYQNDFSVARQQWKGILAVNRYKTFQAFGLLRK